MKEELVIDCFTDFQKELCHQHETTMPDIIILSHPFTINLKPKNYKNIWNILKIKITVNMIDIMILSK